MFVSHNFLSIFWAVLSPLQFSSTIRNKYPEFHKHSGRLLLLTLVPTTATGFRLGMNSKVGKPLMMALGVVLAGYVYLQSFLGYKAITSKPKRVFDHRLAMTKLGICLLGIPLIRLVFFSILVPIIGKLPWPVRTQPDGTQKMIQTLGMSFYTTVLATITGAEVYGFLLQRNKNKLTKSV